MKKNAFTLIELMAVIVIITALLLVASPKIMLILDENRNKGYHEIERRLEEAAAKYIVDKYIDSTITSMVLTKEELINSNYIDEIKDLKDSSVCDAYVNISNLNKRPEYEAVLDCSSYKTQK